MGFESENKYKVIFKDGTSFESRGSASSETKELSINEEFKWVGFHITKEVKQAGRSLSEVERVEYTLSAKVL